MEPLRRRILLLLMVVAASAGRLAASEHRGLVTFAGLPVPGASVTAVQGGTEFRAVTDEQGGYLIPNLADGVASVRIDMLGFVPAQQEVPVGPDQPASTWTLQLLSFEALSRLANAAASGGRRSATNAAAPAPSGPSPRASAPAADTPGTGFQRAEVNAAAPVVAAQPSARPDVATPREETNGDLSQRAADGLLVNGSVNNGAASPFAQLAAFGNNRRGPRSLYNWGLGVQLGDSAWDARPFSFTNQATTKPSYSDRQVVGTFGGPIRIPGLFTNGPTLFVAFQETSNHNVGTQPALVPSLLERGGDFSLSRDASGQPLRIIDPTTGVPFPGNAIPANRLSPQAQALLGYYPAPNLDASGRYNYQTPVLVATRQDAVQTRLTHAVDNRNQLFGTFGYQRTTTDTGTVFGFVDASRVSSLDLTANWSHRFSPSVSTRVRYQFNHGTVDVTPFFAGRTNVSGDAGITGNSQDPVNWGPPSLVFSSGVAGFSGPQFASNRSQTHGWTAEALWNIDRHGLTLGGDVRRQVNDVVSQQDARGTLTFTGSATGSDFADFLLGLPHASAIAFGNADKSLRASAFDAYVTDDWRLSSGLTFNLGLRWEYEAPFAEQGGRLVNLDIAPGFSAISPVVAASPVGALTGQHYPDTLVRGDLRGFQPRAGFAWRPLAGSSLVVRGGYGIYRNTNVYQPLALLMAQQPPLSNSLAIETSAAGPLTLANPFVAPPGTTRNTFAIDPDFRVGFVQTWQASVQRDLPWSTTIIASYLGAKGSRLMQELLPNTSPLGASSPCAACPAGFVFLTSNGRSIRNAGQFELRRRLRSGLTASVQYTWAKAMDDAAAMAGPSLNGAAIAQDWRNLAAEWAPSNFDQRHLVSTQFQYTTGVGLGGGALVSGWRGALFSGWTVTSQLTAGSGLPVTPVFVTSVPGTGVTGSVRASLSGVTDAPAPGLYANPAAYTTPAPGEWGTAGRNSLRGPAQFTVNAGVARTFTLGDRLNLDWRIDALNVLNRVTYAGINGTVGSPQFGLPSLANPMRKLQSTLRLRY